MKKILLLSMTLALTMGAVAQLVPNGNSGASTTAYTNGAPNDPIYIWCSDMLSTTQGSLTATPTNGVGPFTFNWFYHNQSNASWSTLSTQAGASSTINALASDGYRVEIRDAGNNVVDCFTAWVWNLNTQVTASSSRTNCNQANLASTVNTTGTFSYYNPPPPQSLITPSTQIQVCFSATHTWVSDLAFYLVGPPSCGSPTILLSPNPGAIGQGTVCNSGDNVNNLCFTTSPAGNLNVCSPAPATLSGTYSTYGPSSTPINWSSLIGCNAASGGWSVQIYDCISLDVGSLTNSTITFSNLASLCGSPTSISYNSGAINSAINDNSCSAGTASIFSVPPDQSLTTPITVNATTTLQWTANPAVGISNSTSLNATATGVPPGSTDFIQTATTVFGTANCTSDDTTNFNYALPVVNAGQDQTACSGASVTLSGSGAVSYTWDNGVSNGVPFTPGSTATYTVTGTDAAGCTDQDQVDVNVGTTPPVNAGPDQSVCPGGSVTLSGSGAASYSWNNGVTNGVAFTPASTQTYTVTGTDAAGCQGTDQVTVTVDAALNPVVNAGVDQAVCPGTAVTLNGSPGIGGTLSWNNGVTNGVPFTPAATQTYTLTYTDVNNCQGTDQVTVSIHALPPVNAGPDQDVCPGGLVTIFGSGAFSYSWNNGVSNNVPFTPAATQTYTVTGTDVNGCQNTDQVLVVVNTLPNVSAGADQSICQGTAVTLSGSGAVSYSWDNSVINGVQFAPSGTQTYTVTGTDANGCVNTDQVTVTVNPPPAINAGADQTICAGTPVTLSGSGGVSYSWTGGVTNGVPFTPGVGPMTYTVTGTSAAGCQNTDQVTITVVPVPVSVINSAGPLSGYPGLSVTFSNASQFATSYSWDFDNGQTDVTGSLAETASSTFNTPGTYYVELTASNGICSDASSMTVIVFPFEPLVLHIPNVFTPDGDGVNDVFLIDVENGLSIDVLITNRWGNKIAELKDFNESWDGTSNGNELNEGTYFFRYTIGGKDGTTQTGHGFVELVRQ